MFKLNKDSSWIDMEVLEIEEVIELNPKLYEDYVEEEQNNPMLRDYPQSQEWEPDFETILEWYQSYLEDIFENLKEEKSSAAEN